MTSLPGYYTPRPDPLVYTPGFSRDFPPYVVKCVTCGRRGHTKLWPPTWLSDGPCVLPPKGWLGYEDCGDCPPPLLRRIFLKALEVVACVFFGWLLLTALVAAYNVGLHRIGPR